MIFQIVVLFPETMSVPREKKNMPLKFSITISRSIINVNDEKFQPLIVSCIKRIQMTHQIEYPIHL